MTRFAITLEYDGRPFMGWQHQDHGPSVQQSVERAIKTITRQDIRVFAAGRTDAGVHALGMRAHFDLETRLTPFRLMEGLNAGLRPDPVAVLTCDEVDEEWHARFSCIGRRYVYKIINRRAPLTLDKGQAWRVVRPLDVTAMHQAAQCLVGQHDFTTFRSTQCQAQSPVKTLDSISVSRFGEEIEVEVAARSFLHHQVRSMVGSLALVGEGKWTAQDLQDALEARDRKALGHNAPPDGLYFVEAFYPPSETE
ncbi:tRNA pseudouridine38-40 synthase [Parasphingorhabdus marina DSM 22363]|uniref:tRNA pseudouridine synthase A n=1 Tax=Parasphingorhabdus marina DSM 22363 TaxID=1123272 RepID=A0A1N6F8B7_9SPHN|nr:tRNA pseudouridine(38-40) synthase TruA [Parasphingorhabdus marina]SIN91500.1 tRNA pseudouridine38-40 synthase [Parasphingorhabdus marina DSM 22363]